MIQGYSRLVQATHDEWGVPAGSTWSVMARDVVYKVALDDFVIHVQGIGDYMN
jgi:hypothetical protein